MWKVVRARRPLWFALRNTKRLKWNSLSLFPEEIEIQMLQQKDVWVVATLVVDAGKFGGMGCCHSITFLVVVFFHLWGVFFFFNICFNSNNLFFQRQLVIRLWGKKAHIEMDITFITLDTFGCPDISGHLYYVWASDLVKSSELSNSRLLFDLHVMSLTAKWYCL